MLVNNNYLLLLVVDTSLACLPVSCLFGNCQSSCIQGFISCLVCPLPHFLVCDTVTCVTQSININICDCLMKNMMVFVASVTLSYIKLLNNGNYYCRNHCQEAGSLWSKRHLRRQTKLVMEFWTGKTLRGK